jgi:NhaP-type Na+/H+ or K+/H+ antiporter
MNELAAMVIMLCLVGWGLVSRRAARANITGPMVFIVLGLVLANGPLALFDIPLESESVRLIAELTLAILLFSDATRINVTGRRAPARPLRLLLIGLPLTIGFGLAIALLVLGGVNLWIAGLIAAAVAPTDAALGAPVVQDERVPAGIRRLLNVESGLNDGIATPFVFAFLAGAVAGEATYDGNVAAALGDIGIGVAVGIGMGLGVGFALRAATRRGWTSSSMTPIAVFALALACYLVAVELDANGFIAAFVGGIAFSVPTGGGDELMRFSDDAGAGLSLVVWFLFGAAIIVPAFDHLVVGDVVFAVLALTVARMVPVAIALIGTGFDRATVAFIGWFGPRGLASVVFALIAVEQLDSGDAQKVIPAITVTIVLSIIAHGMTAAPFAARYAAHEAPLVDDGADREPDELRARGERSG